jgi:hypothetical protein
MLPPLIAAALLSLPVPVSVADPEKHPEKYEGRIVRIETVLKDFTPGESWSVQLGAEEGIDVIGKTTPPGKNGDRVAITGLFRHKPNTFVPRAIVHATMEVIPFDVTPEQFNKGRSKYEGRLVRIEDKVGEVREWMGTRVIEFVRGIEVECAVKVAVGDRVRVTGVYHPPVMAFDTPRIDVGKGGSVEKVPFDVTPEQLLRDPAAYNGRLVRATGVVRYTRGGPGAFFFQYDWLLEVTGGGKVEAGDRVRVTGVFRGEADAFRALRIDARNTGSVERVGRSDVLPDGTWYGTSLDPAALDYAAVIAKGRLAVTKDGRTLVAGAFTADEAKGTVEVKAEEGEWKGKTFSAAYAVDGKDLTLRGVLPTGRDFVWPFRSKEVPVAVTLRELLRTPVRYHEQPVQLEGEVEYTPEAGDGRATYRLELSPDRKERYHLSITCTGKPTVRKGDTVRVTGLFRYAPGTFDRMSLRVFDPDCSVVKVEPKKP